MATYSTPDGLSTHSIPTYSATDGLRLAVCQGMYSASYKHSQFLTFSVLIVFENFFLYRFSLVRIFFEPIL